MAILDSRSEFADATALSTAGTGLALVGNVIDSFAPSGNHKDNSSGAMALYLVISVDTAILSGGAATVEFQLVSDAQAAIAVDGSATVHYKSGAIPKATLVAGYQIAVQLPPEFPVYEEFLGILQNVGVAALTAGKINAYLTSQPGSAPIWQAYKDAVN